MLYFHKNLLMCGICCFFVCGPLKHFRQHLCCTGATVTLYFACRPNTSSKYHLIRYSSSWLLYPKPEHSDCVISVSPINPPKLALLGSWVVANILQRHQITGLCLINAFKLLLTENSEFMSSVCWHTMDNRFVCVCMGVCVIWWGRLLYILYLCRNLWHLYLVCILLQLLSFQFTGNNLYWDRWRCLSISMTQKDEGFWWLLPNLCIIAVK